jgi:hypothetical protein
MPWPLMNEIAHASPLAGASSNEKTARAHPSYQTSKLHGLKIIKRDFHDTVAKVKSRALEKNNVLGSNERITLLYWSSILPITFMDAFATHHKVISDYRSYLTSFLSIQDERIKKNVLSALNDNGFLPEPLIFFTLKYEISN